MHRDYSRRIVADDSPITGLEIAQHHLFCVSARQDSDSLAR
jgi:hypothetical protein